MTRTAADIPQLSDILCENCGYTLNGLPADSRCPECGEMIDASSPNLRRPSSWETATGFVDRVVAFITTTCAVLFRPSNFFRHLETRSGNRAAFWFAQIHWLIAATGFGFAAAVHYVSFFVLGPPSAADHYLAPIVMIAGAYLLLAVTTWLAAKLTAWEAAYRGLRLPINVVLRGMYFHSAHYLPVALVAFFTVFGYHWLFSSGTINKVNTTTTYLYTLAGEVIVCAGYLFNTYWIGMRNMLYANR